MTTNVLSLTLASGEPLDVRDFTIEEALSRPFDVHLTAMSHRPDVDFEAAIGKAARFEIQRASSVDGDTRYFTGICASIRMLEVEELGLSTYAVRLVPTLWLLTERRNYRVFQDMSELDIALENPLGVGDPADPPPRRGLLREAAHAHAVRGERLRLRQPAARRDRRHVLLRSESAGTA
ncbi:MAG: contractile injection system protein, VgrG/Pvc8 family [Minicystis sp.]